MLEQIICLSASLKIYNSLSKRNNFILETFQLQKLSSCFQRFCSKAVDTKFKLKNLESVSDLIMKSNISEKSNLMGGKSVRSTKVIKYLSSKPELEPIISIVPSDLLNLKKKTKYLYLVDEQSAEKIMEMLMKHVANNGDKIIEVNAGLGFLTKRLLHQNYPVIVYESNEFFFSQIKKLEEKYSELLTVIPNDFMQLYNLKRIDYYDGGSRADDLLKILKKNPWNIGTMKIILAFPNLQFLKRLVSDCFTKSGVATFGRPELYCFLAPSAFRRLTASPNQEKYFYSRLSVLFQNVFDAQLLSSMPRQSFLPWTVPKISKSSAEFHRKIKEYDENNMYLVKIVGKVNFYDKFDENLELYVNFVNQFFKFSNSPIIPHLEKWFPNCGPKLIASDIRVFTHFSDLTPEKIFNLFIICRNFPDFEKSPFFLSFSSKCIQSDENNMDKEEEKEKKVEEV